MGDVAGDPQLPSSGRRRRVSLLPATPLGWWAVRLMAAGVLLTLPVVLFPGVDGPDIFGALCGVVGGGVALRAILRHGERALLVFLAVVPLVLALASFVYRLIFPG